MGGGALHTVLGLCACQVDAQAYTPDLPIGAHYNYYWTGEASCPNSHMECGLCGLAPPQYVYVK